MFIQVLIGNVTILVIVVITVELFSVFSRYIPILTSKINLGLPRFAKSLLTVSAVLWVMFAMTLQVCLWSFVLQVTGAVSGLEPSVYFALVCFTTVGFGDIILSEDWRLLSAIIAANGLIMFSWSAAFLFEALQKIRST